MPLLVDDVWIAVPTVELARGLLLCVCEFEGLGRGNVNLSASVSEAHQIQMYAKYMRIGRLPPAALRTPELINVQGQESFRQSHQVPLVLTARVAVEATVGRCAGSTQQAGFFLHGRRQV